MVDILANGEWGRDDGIKCHACGGKTYLTDDQGYGLCSYNCENCDEITQVQFEWDYDEEPDWEQEYYDDSPGMFYDDEE